VRTPRPKPARYEGKLLVSEVRADGSTDDYWDTEENVARKMGPHCGTCCHPPTAIVVVGKCVDGKVNGKPLRHYVPRLDERT